MAGIDATVKGYVIDPRLPLPHYTLRMPNFGIRVSQASVDGYCRTESAEAFEIKLKLVAGNQPTTAWVDLTGLLYVTGMLFTKHSLTSNHKSNILTKTLVVC